jgi:hypothetical protein
MGYDIIFSMLKNLATKVTNIFLLLFNSQTIIGLTFNCTFDPYNPCLTYTNEFHLSKKRKTKK